MNDLTALEALHESYLALTAFLFDLALCIVVLMQGGARKETKSRFLSVSIVVTVSVFLSFFNFFFLHVDTGLPQLITLFFQLAAYMANIFVTYYLTVYLGGFFHEHAVPEKAKKFNRVLLIAGCAALVTYFILQVVSAARTGEVHFVSGWFRALVGYAIELYYMIFCVMFVRFRNELNFRARLTIVIAFVLSVISFVMQAMLGARPLVNYLGVSIALLIFYFSAETPDYHKLQEALIALEEEKKSAEEARRRADEANRSKSDFLANMSHEIRTPINAVLGMNELILREGNEAAVHTSDKDLRETFDNITEYASDVDSAGKSLLAIINDILDFSKIEAGRMEIMAQSYHLSSVINDVCNMILFRARAKNLGFHVDVEQTLPDVLDGDEVRIRQIMVNLLGNAVKYTDTGSVTLRVSGLRTGEDQIDLVITVSDTGIGIHEEDVQKLFSKFERVDLNRNNQVEGSGLGLAITHQLVKMMNGTIDVKSEYGKGSVFTVYLPQRVLPGDAIGDFRERLKHQTQDVHAHHTSFRAPGTRILAVDDTPVNLSVIEGLIKHTLIVVEKATSGEQALSLTKDTPYDLILMDQRMPKMNGTEAMRLIRAQEGGCNHKTPVICLTADAVQNARSRYLEEGFTDYLSKPVEGRALELMLTKYLPKGKVFAVREEAHVKTGAETTVQTKAAPERDVSSMRERYASVSALHYEDAKMYLASDEIITDTLRQFTESIPDNADEIERLWKEGDIENYTIKVHALKSAARMVGLRDLSEMARGLEAAGNRVMEDKQ